jgi:hypothetical protein
MAINTAAQGARTMREERARREKERIKIKASVPHTKLEDTTHESLVFTVHLRMLPYIYRT